MPTVIQSTVLKLDSISPMASTKVAAFCPPKSSPRVLGIWLVIISSAAAVMYPVITEREMYWTRLATLK